MGRSSHTGRRWEEQLRGSPDSERAQAARAQLGPWRCGKSTERVCP